MKNKVFSLILSFLLGLHIHAAEKNVRSNQFILKDSIYAQNIFHNETSGDSRFFTLNRKARMTTHDIRLAYVREVFADSLFSLSLSLEAGKILGRGGEDDETLNYQYETKIKNGWVGGAELTLNMNFFYSGIRIQPFIGGAVTQRNFDFETNYARFNSADSLTLIYDIESQYNYAVLGSRFLDPEQELMSYFSIGYLVSDSTTFRLQSAQAGINFIDLTQAASAENANINTFTFNIGFGMTF
jgi:hypothetical protein